MTGDQMQLAQSLVVHDVRDFIAIEGANFGDPMAEIAQLVPSDIYQLRRDTVRQRLVVTRAPNGGAVVAPGSPAGQPGASISILGEVTLMSSQDGAPCPGIMLASDAQPDHARQVWLMSFGVLHHTHAYSVIHAHAGPCKALIAQLGSASFVAGTQVLMARGGQQPIETLTPGDLVVTRSRGPQPVRAVSHQTLRAEGMFAPIVLQRGTLNTTDDLWLSPQHRLFIYQRQDHLGLGRKELTVQAEMLVNGVDIVQKSGGFLEYHEVVFDRPEIIFVNGIAAESRFTPILGPGPGNDLVTAAPNAMHLNTGDLAKPLEHHRIRVATSGTAASRASQG